MVGLYSCELSMYSKFASHAVVFAPDLASGDVWATMQLWDISLAVNRHASAVFKESLTLDFHLRSDGDNMAIGLAYGTTQTFVWFGTSYNKEDTICSRRYDTMTTRYAVADW